MIKGLHHNAYRCRDSEETRRFYEDFLGLPLGRDMDGYARTDLFQPAFTEERPITFIPTYDR